MSHPSSQEKNYVGSCQVFGLIHHRIRMEKVTNVIKGHDDHDEASKGIYGGHT